MSMKIQFHYSRETYYLKYRPIGEGTETSYPIGIEDSNGGKLNAKTTAYDFGRIFTPNLGPIPIHPTDLSQ
jgi:hypothetical protein